MTHDLLDAGLADTLQACRTFQLPLAESMHQMINSKEREVGTLCRVRVVHTSVRVVQIE